MPVSCGAMAEPASPSTDDLRPDRPATVQARHLRHANASQLSLITLRRGRELEPEFPELGARPPPAASCILGPATTTATPSRRRPAGSIPIKGAGSQMWAFCTSASQQLTAAERLVRPGVGLGLLVACPRRHGRAGYRLRPGVRQLRRQPGSGGHGVVGERLPPPDRLSDVRHIRAGQRRLVSRCITGCPGSGSSLRASTVGGRCRARSYSG
jgi:hypothetical protein